jgi:glucokinase
MADSYIAVDLGGTQIRAARGTPDGKIQARHQMLTLAHEGAPAVLARIKEAIAAVWPPAGAGGIGVVAPGPLDPWQGLVISAPNLPGWDNVPLRDILAQHFGTVTSLGNDANLAGLAEWRFGAGRGYNDLIYMTISTGIGGGVIIGGQMLLGARGLAAELGHISVQPDGPRCNCGNYGCLEKLAAGPAIAAQAVAQIIQGRESLIPALVNGHLQSVNAATVGQAAADGDPLAQEVIAHAGYLIGVGIVNLLHAFNPSIVILGGGVTQIGALLFDPIQRVVKERVMRPEYLVPIVPAALGGDVGLLGALALALETAGRS